MFGPNDRLISGVEPHERKAGEEYASDSTDEEVTGELWRIFVGPRAFNKYVLVDFAQAKAIYAAFQGAQRLFVPITGEMTIFEVEPEEWHSAEEEKAMFYRVEELMKREAADVG